MMLFLHSVICFNKISYTTFILTINLQQNKMFSFKMHIYFFQILFASCYIVFKINLLYFHKLNYISLLDQLIENYMTAMMV